MPSSTTLAGVLRHLAVAERNWFQHIVARQLAPIDDDEDASWFVDEATVDELIADYARACRESRDIASGFALEDVVPPCKMGSWNLTGQDPTFGQADGDGDDHYPAEPPRVKVSRHRLVS